MNDDIAQWMAAIRTGSRRHLAQALTLVESRRDADDARAQALLECALAQGGDAIRLALTGVPGAGKSSLLEVLGQQLTAAGHHVAVLAVDPSSVRSGGSLMGDKTRMTELARNPRAFIRPSPTAGALGGVAERTYESMLLCEAAGYDVVIVETVGVGQSEVTVADLVDYVLLLALPGAGDELQGIKRGILEVCDAIVVTKADGNTKDAAVRARDQLRAAVSILRLEQDGTPVTVETCSAVTGEGNDAVWQGVVQARVQRAQSGAWAARRARQLAARFDREIEHALVRRLRAVPQLQALQRMLRAEVEAGRMLPRAAAAKIWEAFSEPGSLLNVPGRRAR